MKKIGLCVVFIVTFLLHIVNAIAEIHIETVKVGDSAKGGIDYEYRIGQTEVTVSQYVNFLNSVAVDDLNDLYTGSSSGILRSGTPSSYVYSSSAGWENKPVTYVTWLSAARFANWCNNGQPIGTQGFLTTENGAYDLSVSNPLANALRESNAIWALPSDSEWVKAAYYDPTINGFWQYPTRSNTPPVGELPPGGSSSTNNYGVIGHLIDVGSYTNSTSYYGTFDQIGNVWELVEDMYVPSDSNDPIQRYRRGDSFSGWYGSGSIGHLVGTGNNTPNSGDSDTGFRLVYFPEQQVVPEPSSLLLLGTGLIPFLRRKFLK